MNFSLRRRVVEPLERLTQDEFDRLRCSHCGGVHSRACPRVRRMVFDRNGADLLEVEFWPSFNEDGIIWPESIYDDEPDEQEDGVG